MSARAYHGGGVLGLTGWILAGVLGCVHPTPFRDSCAPRMVAVPAGLLERGDHSGRGYADQRPARQVAVEGFWMDVREVTWGEWEPVRRWGVAHGYSFDHPARSHPARGPEHPVCDVSWYDAVKWCNARSEHAGRCPVYYTDEGRTVVFRSGRVDLGAAMVRWEADGFRLPTEAEWEWAARGGKWRHHYPWHSPGEQWSGWLDGSRANYWESGDPWESEAECSTTPAGYFDSRQVPAGGDMANGYGLYDMAGNVAEWCWDWYHDRWYEDEASGEANTRGPAWGYGRVLRGGSWISGENYLRVCSRYMSAADYTCHCYGFRTVARTPLPGYSAWGRKEPRASNGRPFTPTSGGT